MEKSLERGMGNNLSSERFSPKEKQVQRTNSRLYYISGRSYFTSSFEAFIIVEFALSSVSEIVLLSKLPIISFA